MTQLLVPIQQYYSTSVIRKSPYYYGQLLRSPQVHYREVPLYLHGRSYKKIDSTVNNLVDANSVRFLGFYSL